MMMELILLYVCLFWITVYLVPNACSCGRDFDLTSLCETLGVMTDLWLISVPLDKTSLTSVEKLKRTIAKTNLASCCKFSIPDLKVRLFIAKANEEPDGAKYSIQSK